jgi:preprotein translocase subunit Sec61beta
MPSLKKHKSEGPVGGAGLIRYFDVDEGGPKVDPKIIIGIAVAIILLELMSKIINEQ